MAIESLSRYIHLKKKDLIPSKNLTPVFEEIRNYLAGNMVGVTRDETIVNQIINLLFCKIIDEKNSDDNDTLQFQHLNSETKKLALDRITKMFEEVKKRHSSIFSKEDILAIDATSLVFVLEKLQRYSLLGADRDSVADAFQAFIGPALRGAEGQFFTPRNVIKSIIAILDPKKNETVIDPACGTGGFLISALNHVWGEIDEVTKIGSKENRKLKTDVATRNFRGIDKDKFLVKLAKAYMTIIGDGESGIFCENSLSLPTSWYLETRKSINLNGFDVVVTNPPFGAKIPIRDKETLKQYLLGQVWEKDDDSWKQTEIVKETESPQLLFVERCFQLLKKGGRIAIILPEGYWASPSNLYIWEFIRKNARIDLILDLPRTTFQPHTDTKTNVLFLTKEKSKEDYELIMAIVNAVGHGKTGKEIYKLDDEARQILDGSGNMIIHDELPEIASKIAKLMRGQKIADNRVFKIKLSEIKNDIFIPRYYDKDLKVKLEEIKTDKRFETVSLGKLEKEGVISVHNGHGGINSDWFGKGPIPYIRTSDIANWEISHFSDKTLPEWVYKEKSQKIGLKKKDLLLVRRGRYRIGNMAIVTEEDTKSVVQAEISILRIENPNNKYHITPELLLYCLSQPFTKRQMKNKIFVETTLQNLGNRWRELFIVIPKSLSKRKEIEIKINKCVTLRNKGLELIRKTRNENLL